MVPTVGRALPGYAGCAAKRTHEARRRWGEDPFLPPNKSDARTSETAVETGAEDAALVAI